MFTTQDFTTLWQHLEVPIFIGYTVSGDIIDKTALPGKYKAWIYQHNSSLASTCVRRAINISGIDGTIDQCTLEDGSRFSEASAALLSTSREQSCNYWCMTSVFKEIKVTKFRQFLMMRDSSDAKVREARASRRTGRSQPRRQYERQSGWLLGSVCDNRQARIRNNTIEKIGYNSSGEEALVRNQEEFFFRFSSSVFLNQDL